VVVAQLRKEKMSHHTDETLVTNHNATAVDPKTWRKVRITAGDWQIDALRPIAWLAAHNIFPKAYVRIGKVIDIGEMGAPSGLVGKVESIEPCPPIADGPGRVVLTTISHRDDLVFDLTLRDAWGKSETIGVTGHHCFYDQAAGWVQARYMRPGHILRGALGDLTVAALARRPGSHRVYNIAVESDHVFYAGNLSALVHNNCPAGAGDDRGLGPVDFEKDDIKNAIRQLLTQIHDLSDMGENTEDKRTLLDQSIYFFKKLWGEDPLA
jgi:hypothetical protein